MIDTSPGLITRSTGAFYNVLLTDGRVVNCTLKGKMRLDGLKTTNPVAVGDRVLVDMRGAAPVIADIEPRKNYLLRKAVKSSAQTQILACNLDAAVMVVSLVSPFTPLTYLDAFLVMTEAYHIPAILVFNKLDLISKDKDQHKLQDLIATYEAIGYATHCLSANDPSYRPLAQQVLVDKITFLCGVSGSGKSSFVNLAAPGLNLRTSSVSLHTNKGRHTTTYAELHPLPFGGAVIDAPGFREYEPAALTVEELSHFYPEMRERLQACKYNNCTHTSEPNCAIIDAVNAGQIALTRYNTYTALFNNLLNSNKR